MMLADSSGSGNKSSDHDDDGSQDRINTAAATLHAVVIPASEPTSQVVDDIVAKVDISVIDKIVKDDVIPSRFPPDPSLGAMEQKKDEEGGENDQKEKEEVPSTTMHQPVVLASQEPPSSGVDASIESIQNQYKEKIRTIGTSSMKKQAELIPAREPQSAYTYQLSANYSSSLLTTEKNVVTGAPSTSPRDVRPESLTVSGMQGEQRDPLASYNEQTLVDQGITTQPLPVIADSPSEATITATPVVEPVYAEVTSTTAPIDKQNRIFLDRRMFVCCVALVILLIVTFLSVIVPFVIVPSRNQKLPPLVIPSATPATALPSIAPSAPLSAIPSGYPSAMPTTERFSAIADIVAPLSATLPGTLQMRAGSSSSGDSASPQYLAANWVAAHDPANVPLSDVSTIRQRYILALLFYSTDGENWYKRNKFLSGLDECEWGGDEDWIRCDADGNVIAISMEYNRLEGTVPPQIGSLSKLTSLSLPENRLFGPIPTELSSLRRLTKLDLKWNRLTGVVPSQLGLLTKLRQLYLSENESLRGTLPTQLGKLVQLEDFYLDDTGLTGNLPSELGLLTSLEVIDFRRNNFNGTIPYQWGKLIKLTELQLSSNELTGRIPSELGMLSELAVLSLARNGLTGYVPASLGYGLSGDVYLHSNDLTGGAGFLCRSNFDIVTVDNKKVECSCSECCPCKEGNDCSYDLRF